MVLIFERKKSPEESLLSTFELSIAKSKKSMTSHSLLNRIDIMWFSFSELIFIRCLLYEMAFNIALENIIWFKSYIQLVHVIQKIIILKNVNYVDII